MEKTFKSERELAEFLATETEWLYNRIYLSIEEAFYHPHMEAEILIAKVLATKEEEEQYVDITSPVEEWSKSLKLCITHFEEKEEYEKCHDAKLLLEDIVSKYSELYENDEQEEI